MLLVEKADEPGRSRVAGKRRRRGSAALEAALVVIPMLAFLLAIIDYSVAVFIRNSLMNATREGVRFGITSRTVNGLSHDNSIKNVMQRYAMGFLNGSSASRIAIRYWNPQTGTFATGVGSNRSGNILEISVENYPWIWIAPVLRNTAALSFTAQSSDIMEPQPNGIPAR
jgi:Flp pilus assembly protein TadG